MKFTLSAISPRATCAAAACAAALIGQSAMAQDRALAFSLTGGASYGPSYFGSDSYDVSPSGSFGFVGLDFGALRLGDPDNRTMFAPGTGVRGAFRFIGEREGKDELAGLNDVDASVELGIGLQSTSEFAQVFADVRYGVIGHEAVSAEVGANLIYRGNNGFVLHGGPRAEFGNARFMRTYFGVTPAESARSGLAAYRPDGGLQSLGLEIGAYQPLNDDWGITGSVRYDRLQEDAADSPIVRQGERDQFSVQIGLTRHFNLRF